MEEQLNWDKDLETRGDFLMESIGKVVRDRRIQLKWTQEEVAKRAKVSPATVSRIELETFVRTDLLESVCRALGIPEPETYTLLSMNENEYIPEDNNLGSEEVRVKRKRGQKPRKTSFGKKRTGDIPTSSKPVLEVVFPAEKKKAVRPETFDSKTFSAVCQALYENGYGEAANFLIQEGIKQLQSGNAHAH